MFKILDNIYIWLFLENSESVSLLPLVKYTFVYLFYPKNSTIDSRKTSLIQERLVVGSCRIPDWIAFVMLYRLVYNVRSHFNELNMAWNAYERQTG